MSRSLTLTAALLAASALAIPAAAKDCPPGAKEAAVHVTPASGTAVQVAMNHGMKTAGTIVDIAAGNPDFSTLVTALKAADLVTTLQGEGPFTVFAPTNAAFAKLPAGTVENLLKPENKAQLAAILTYHVVPGRTLSTDLAGKTLEVATVNGAKVKIDGTNGVKVNDATVSSADIAGSNGVIHVVDTVILPPAKTGGATKY